MKRRFFLSSGALALSAMSVMPLSIFANCTPTSIYDIGKGFGGLKGFLQHIPSTHLPQGGIVAHTKLIQVLEKQGYAYSTTEILQLSATCFAIPVLQKTYTGSSKQLALLLGHKGNFKHHILNEKTTITFNAMIENFMTSINSNQLEIDPLPFITPSYVIKEFYGKNSVFSYKNTSGNTITLKSSSKKQFAIIN